MPRGWLQRRLPGWSQRHPPPRSTNLAYGESLAAHPWLRDGDDEIFAAKLSHTASLAAESSCSKRAAAHLRGNAKVTRRSRVAKTQPVAKPRGYTKTQRGPKQWLPSDPFCSEAKNYFTSSQRSSAYCQRRS